MKKYLIGFICLAAVSCIGKPDPGTQDPQVKDPITIESPAPRNQITKVSLTEKEQGYMAAGNAMSFRFLNKLYNGKNLICSPLSLQYALAMTANGASGETLQEIIDFLGYGQDGIQALNAYSKKLIEELPAVDLDVTLKLTDAILVNDQFPLLPAFKQTVESNYYAAVENMSFADPEYVAARINEWAKRNTNGFIDKVLDGKDVSEDAVAFLMNALYFKAKWEGSEYSPMFREYATAKEKFTLEDGTTKVVDMMNNERWHLYAKMDGYKVLALPYAGGKFFMYILLPDSGKKLGDFLNVLQSTPWATITGSLKQDREVFLKLPKFDIEDKYYLTETLQALGVKRAFVRGDAQFDGMFAPKPGAWFYWIGKVIQKARISVAEWGTEAAAVTVVEMEGATSAGPGEEGPLFFYADHPFVYVIGEATSGAILFEGVYTGIE